MAEPIYRAPMRARDRDDVAAGVGADFGLEHGVVGIGDRLPSAPRDLEAAVEVAGDAHGPKAARMLRTFAELPTGTLVWTRDSMGMYALGRIDGPWRYDDSAAARAVGIHHVRSTVWADREFTQAEVPPAVAATFARGGRNLQRTHETAAERTTAALWSAGSR